MPPYVGPDQAHFLRDNSTRFMWNNELVAAGTLSQSFVIERINRSYYPWGLSVEVVFSSNPGVFEIDIMGANTDKQANYIQIGSITSAAGSTVGGNYVGRWDMPSNIWAKYVAGYVRTLTNAVNTTLQVTR